MDINLTKPLARGRRITIWGETLWVIMKYEKLPKIYFKCGRILHTEGGCLINESSPKISMEGGY